MRLPWDGSRIQGRTQRQPAGAHARLVQGARGNPGLLRAARGSDGEWRLSTRTWRSSSSAGHLAASWTKRTQALTTVCSATVDVRDPAVSLRAPAAAEELELEVLAVGSNCICSSSWLDSADWSITETKKITPASEIVSFLSKRQPQTQCNSQCSRLMIRSSPKSSSSVADNRIVAMENRTKQICHGTVIIDKKSYLTDDSNRVE